MYAEDSSGAVVEEPPAIGPVTERSQVDRERPLGLGLPTRDFEDPLPVEEFDPAELDASFAPVDGSPSEMSWDSPVASPPAQAPLAPPPPPPPPSSRPQAPVPTAVPHAPSAPSEPSGAVTEEVPVDAEPTVRMEVPNPPTAQIPAVSSRGDIIAAGPRKLTVRDRLTPAVRVPKQVATETKSRSEAPRGTKPIVAFLVMAVSFAGTLWRMEGLREKLFGGGAPSAEAVEQAFGTLQGYEYQPVSEGEQQMLDAMEKIIAEQAEASGTDIEFNFDARSLLRGGRPIGAVLIFSTDPDDLTEQGQTDFRTGMEGSGAKLQPIRLGGSPAFATSTPQGGSAVVFFDPDGFVFMVVAQNQVAGKDVATQLIRANV